MKLSKASVSFERPAAKIINRCELCKHFEAPSSCAIVSGDIRPGDWCDRFSRKRPIRSSSSLRYAFFIFSGQSFPIAKRLADEGNEVVVGQVSRSSQLNVSGWQGEPEQPEQRRRRLSVYDGMVDKIDADKLLRQISSEVDSWFVITDHNNLCEYGERLLSMGASGFISNRADFSLEKDRAAAKEFVRKNYDMVDVPESKLLKKAEDGVNLIEDSDDLWVLKSNGNIGQTIVPKTDDVQLNHMEIVGALKTNTKDYESEGFVLEKKVRRCIEFTPELAFWNGTPIYSNVEIECKPIGAGDTGPDGGGAINLMVRTELDDPINTMFFPPAVHKLAKTRRGLFIFDAGILYDLDSDTYFFTEFAGNRWSGSGVFSELAMATDKNRSASEYFERIAAGKNPLRYDFGVTVALYNILPDPKFPKLQRDGVPIYWRRAAEDYLWLVQARKDESGTVVCVGGDSDSDGSLLGYASACGSSLAGCVDAAYEVVRGVSFRELVFRPKSDFLSRGYPSAILNRFEFLNKEHFSVPGFRRSA